MKTKLLIAFSAAVAARKNLQQLEYLAPETESLMPIPNKGDWVSFAWLGDGETFEVEGRVFTYSDPEHLTVQLDIGDIALSHHEPL